MNKNILISVIIPVYNVKEYLDTCLKSVLNQTYSNLEIILVDDGSTDGSGELCDEYARKDERILVVHKKNGGLSDARNVGIEKARGVYIGFVDSDDWIDCNMYEILLSHILQYNADIAICEAIEVCGNLYHDRACAEETILAGKEQALDILYEGSKYKCHAWNKLYKTQLFSEVRFPVGKYYEDVFVMHLIFQQSEKVVFLDKGLYYYRQRHNSIVHAKNLLPIMDLFEALGKQYESCTTNKRKYYVANTILNTMITTKNSVFNLKDKSNRKKYNIMINQYYDKYAKGNITVNLKNYIKISYRYVPQVSVVLFKTFEKILNSQIIMHLRKIRYAKKCCKKNGNDVIIKLKSTLGKKRIILMGSPEYNNLGDLAIAFSIKNFVMENFENNYIYIEIPENWIRAKMPLIKSYISQNDILLLTGGGNLGDVYMDQQLIRKKVLKKFKKNKIILMPQTAYFNKTSQGQEELEKTKKLYSKHKNMMLFAREEYSYKYMQANFRNIPVKLVPDIVLYNNYVNDEVIREKILLCLRSDKETVLNECQRNDIIYTCIKKEEIDIWDTCLPYNVNLESRDQEVKKAWDFIAKHKLVITDRLHGVIFSAITGTPCVSISNSNYKIKGIYKWLEKLEYIAFCETIDTITDTIEFLLKKYPNGAKKNLDNALFDELKQGIMNVKEN